MKPRSIIVAALLVVAGLFAALNWSTFSAPTRLNLLLDEIEAPLGWIMLCFVGVLSIVYLVLLARIEAGALLEGRRQARELDRLRKLVEEGEESRLRRLQDYLGQELDSLHDRISGLEQTLVAQAGPAEPRPVGPAPEAVHRT